MAGKEAKIEIKAEIKFQSVEMKPSGELISQQRLKLFPEGIGEQFEPLLRYHFAKICSHWA